MFYIYTNIGQGRLGGGGGGMLVKVMDVFPILLEVFQMSIGKGGDWGGMLVKIMDVFPILLEIFQMSIQNVSYDFIIGQDMLNVNHFVVCLAYLFSI